MKLESHKPTTTFYETFSDLIFATMAIFVLLMMLFIIQVNSAGTEDLEEEIEVAAAQLETISAEVSELVQKIEKMERSKQSPAEYHIELVIAVDTTGSMQLELDQLTSSIALIAEVLPNISNSAKIGVIAYRNDENDESATQVFPLQRIQPKHQDQGVSYSRLFDFVRGLTAKTGSAPLEQAINSAVSQFSKLEDFTGHQTLMILGDVGPYEDFYQDQDISQANLNQETGIIRQIGYWMNDSLERKILVVFAGEDEIAETEGDQHEKFVASRKFFERIAVDLEVPDGFSTSSADMIPLLLSGVLP